MTQSTSTLEPSETAPEHSKFLGPAVIVVTVILIAALAAAAWFGYGWAHALFVDKSTAQARDEALAGAEQVAVNLNTVDAANIDKSFENMKSSITGDTMLNDLQSTEAGITDQVKQSGAVSTAELLHGTLTEFNKGDQTATALMVVATTTTRPNTAPDKSKVTMRLTMQKVDGVWKANNVIPVGTRISMNPPAAAATTAAPAPGAAAAAPSGAAAPPAAVAPAAPAPAAPAPTTAGQ